MVSGTIVVEHVQEVTPIKRTSTSILTPASMHTTAEGVLGSSQPVGAINRLVQETNPFLLDIEPITVRKGLVVPRKTSRGKIGILDDGRTTTTSTRSLRRTIVHQHHTQTNLRRRRSSIGIRQEAEMTSHHPTRPTNTLRSPSTNRDIVQVELSTTSRNIHNAGTRRPLINDLVLDVPCDHE